MKFPDFFIIGAPKCGTTSMAAWLSEHTSVYMSPVKEPNYFSTDLKLIYNASTSEYKRLFEAVRSHHRAVGEASVWYLYSRVAVNGILESVSEPRFVVMVRNPVEMAYSLYDQLVFDGNEHITDFERAWRLQPDRAEGREVSRWCADPKLLLYGEICRLGEQLKRLYDHVPRNIVLPVVLDDVKEDPRREYLRVLEFLGVPDDGRRRFPVANSAKERRSPSLGKIVRSVSLLKRRFGLPRFGTGLLRRVDSLNARPKVRMDLSREMREELQAYFRPDVELLGDLLKRDLTSWVK